MFCLKQDNLNLKLPNNGSFFLRARPELIDIGQKLQYEPAKGAAQDSAESKS